ncbi:uncharacterized protein Gasu_59520 [Galdieria sulphuraria]|uniref:Uncharacterized protein n=1 Tax=Galdieria sulphuraria TaxID=130081 RepID=M2WRG3_GALSU|nr:uncharacterized protein Gasu_59520 [Galdieria sulphuraria]EME26390.1 hypothetical protein Gasu_59520 [Galdieria sulphuraria]|eukprot:XP_005702910.1 hypothetical protein Gasu_59520 [Galdieria sulphuraria]
MNHKVVLFREDTRLEDNLINLLKDLYDFQEPCRDNTPWLYFVERLERFLEICRTPKEKWYLESLIIIFQLHHFVNYQHISYSVLEFSRWLSCVDKATTLSHDCTDNNFCAICKKYLLQVTTALFIRISFYGGHSLMLESIDRNPVISLYSDEFYSYTLSSFLGTEPLLALSIWCDYSSFSQHEKETSWDTFLQSVCQTKESRVENHEKTYGVECWKAVWIRPTLKWWSTWKNFESNRSKNRSLLLDMLYQLVVYSCIYVASK